MSIYTLCFCPNTTKKCNRKPEVEELAHKPIVPQEDERYAPSQMEALAPRFWNDR